MICIVCCMEYCIHVKHPGKENTDLLNTVTKQQNFGIVKVESICIKQIYDGQQEEFCP